MNPKVLFAPLLLLSTVVALADDPPAPKPPDGATEAQTEKKKEEAKEDPNLGMSILGNQEAPKSLVIVPWKSSAIGRSLGISTMLDDSRQPIDKEVFMRVLSYYDLSSTTTRHDGAPAGSNAPRPAAAAHGRKP